MTKVSYILWYFQVLLKLSQHPGFLIPIPANPDAQYIDVCYFSVYYLTY